MYTCALNDKGGVEADVTIGAIESGSGVAVHDPKLKGQGYYIVAGGASAFHTYNHLRKAIRDRGFQATVEDVTEQMGVISIQGPNSRKILQRLTDFELSNDNLQPNCNAVINVKTPEGGMTREEQKMDYQILIPCPFCNKITVLCLLQINPFVSFA